MLQREVQAPYWLARAGVLLGLILLGFCVRWQMTAPALQVGPVSFATILNMVVIQPAAVRQYGGRLALVVYGASNSLLLIGLSHTLMQHGLRAGRLDVPVALFGFAIGIGGTFLMGRVVFRKW